MHKILFVCLGNICRSPAAHAVMDHNIKINNLQDLIEVDSAGTSDHHEGQFPDQRMRDRGSLRNYRVDSLSRPFNKSDFQNFDLIIVMDKSNYKNVIKLSDSEKDITKVKYFSEFCTRFKIEEVPDPYWGGAKDFDHVLDICEDGVSGIIKSLGYEKK